MAETTIEERLISGTGVLRVPSTEAPIRYYSLLLDVIRQPSRTDRSFNYNPYRQRYATLVFLRKGYVIQEAAMDYTKRRFDWVVDVTAQVLVAQKCAQKELLAKLYAPGTAPDSNIKTFHSLNLLWDEVRIVCYLDTALQVRLRSDNLDDCGDDFYETSPPPPPSSLPPVPTGTPIADISRPYPDDDVSSPYDGDEFSPPPSTDPPRTCVQRTVTVLWFFNNDPGNGRTTTVTIYGDAGEVRNGDLGDGTYALQVRAWGLVGDPAGCQSAPLWVNMVSPTGNPNQYGSPTIQSIVPPQ